MWDKTFKYRNSHRNLMLQYIRDKKLERNIMRIGMNAEIKQDTNQTQLNSTKQKQESINGVDNLEYLEAPKQNMNTDNVKQQRNKEYNSTNCNA